MKWGLVLWGLVVCWALPGTSTCEAVVLDWPILKQGSNVVRCLVSDVGKITTSLVTHATGFATETLETVGQCLIYVAGQATGVPDPNPLHTEEPHG